MKINKILIITLTLIIMITSVEATNIQSKPGVPALVQKTAFEFFQLLRETEKEGGALGLNATFEEQDNAYIETSTSNNIDSHMMKNTECGAVIMLAVSPYGAGHNNVKATYDTTTYIYDVTASTTGNMTGVFGMNAGLGQYEYMAAGVKNDINNDNSKRYFKYSPNRYVDNYLGYVAEENYIPGDATYEMYSFGATRFIDNETSPVMLRGLYGMFFIASTYGYQGNMGARLAIWNGQGI